MILEMLIEAVGNLNWELITLSRYQYPARRPIRLKDQPWQERTFAYELYHQLRILWDKNPELQEEFVIQAEVRKAYQHIPDFDRIPDFIFHLPRPGQNLAVVEIKLAARGVEQVRMDVIKLCEFQRRPQLRYSKLIEILLGPLEQCEDVAAQLATRDGMAIELLFVTPGEGVTGQRQVRFQPSKRRLKAQALSRFAKLFKDRL